MQSYFFLACQGSSRQKLYDRSNVRLQYDSFLRKELSNRLSNLSEAVEEDLDASAGHAETRRV